MPQIFVARKTACEQCSAVSRTKPAIVTIYAIDKMIGDEHMVLTLCHPCWNIFQQEQDDQGNEVRSQYVPNLK